MQNLAPKNHTEHTSAAHLQNHTEKTSAAQRKHATQQSRSNFINQRTSGKQTISHQNTTNTNQPHMNKDDPPFTVVSEITRNKKSPIFGM